MRLSQIARLSVVSSLAFLGRFGGLLAYIKFIHPPMAELAVVIFDNQLKEPVMQIIALMGCKTVDANEVIPSRKEAFPPSDWVSPDNGVDSR